MKTDSTQFTTPKGHRVYKRSRVVNGQRVFADTYTLRVKQDGETAYFKLGTVKREASLKADEIMAFLAVSGNTLDEALVRYSERHKSKALRAAKAPEPVVEVLTVGAMIKAFLAVTNHLSATTRRNDTQALRHIAAGIMNLPKLGVNQTKAQQAEWRAKVEAFPMSGFTAPEIERFRQRELAACNGDHRKAGAAATTLNSYLRAARGVFSKKLLPLYDGLQLPDQIPFRGIAPLPEPSHRYHSKIDAVRLIELAKAELYHSDKDAWLAFILCIGAGLRRAELDKLEWEQVCLSERRVHIRTTEFFRPKAKNSEAYVDFSEAVAAYLKEYQAIGENGKRRFVLPGLEVGDKIRCLKVFSSLMTWLRAQGVPGRTPLHTLRKEAGSLIFQKAGSIDRAAEFLRNDPRVAREHYVGRKERIELEISGL